MRYISLDLETTSLMPSPDNILQLSMVYEDSNNPIPIEDLPHFTVFIKRDKIVGQPYALAMNSWILDYISGYGKKESPYPIMEPDSAFIAARYWALSQFKDVKYKIPLAGKNVASFDVQFLPDMLKNTFSHRVIDIGPMFIDWENDNQPPNFSECMQRAGITGHVTHDALEDARGVIRILRTTYSK